MTMQWDGSRLVCLLSVPASHLPWHSLALRTFAPLLSPRKGRRQLLVLRKRRTRLKNFSAISLARCSRWS
jgi:hypothetical protein